MSTIRWWLLWKWRNIAGALIVLTIVACIFAFILIPHRKVNWGFGPEWQCTNYAPGYNALVCFKQNAPADKP
jgi:hypothetical protein